MESNLSRAATTYYDDQPHSDGPWANAWVAVWEKTAPHQVTPRQWVALPAAQTTATFAPANPKTKEEETLYA